MPKQWFHNWFNSPYYHLLYSKHDDKEAAAFIDHLYQYLKPQISAKVLDVACGRGRHAIYLNRKGLDVTGIDLSIANITFAKQSEKSGLRFFVHDMRSLSYKNYFDIAFNLFTSFGYFETDQEHISALSGIQRALKPGGLFVLDYFNSEKVLNNIVPAEVKTIAGIDFHIQKSIGHNSITKKIDFDDKGETFSFREIVRTFTLADFEKLFDQSGFDIMNTYGNYNLDTFAPQSSDRLIFICKNKNA